jgi:hypothetical protein
MYWNISEEKKELAKGKKKRRKENIMGSRKRRLETLHQQM